MNPRSAARVVHTIVATLTASVVTLGALTADHVSLAQELPAAAAESVQNPFNGVSVADLEKAFWACDYRATTHGVHATPVEICATATAELKRLKFGGSFEELLAWWHLNKLAEHRALEQSGSASPWTY
jgi:hypothetical protein